MALTTYLVTGAARGIGRALVGSYAQRPDSIVIAAVRDPSTEHAKSLTSLPTGKGTKLIIVKIESTSETDPGKAVQELKSHGITTLDVVIANAGIALVYPHVHEAAPKDMMEHFQVNVIGPVLLFAAVRPLMLEAAKSNSTPPRFVIVGSSAGSISTIKEFHVPNTAYGTSKAAVHWIATKINYENPEIIAFPLNPGWLQTDMGNSGAKALGIAEQAPLTVEDALPGALSIIDTATKEKYAGELTLYTGEKCEW